MRIEVLGKSPAWTDAGGACSGYLVQDGDTRLLLDCGNGVFGKLRAATDPFALDAVVISHVHADHVLDLVPFAYFLLFARDPPLTSLPLHAPPGGAERLARLSGIWGDEGLIPAAFDVREYDPSAPLRVGALELAFAPVPHYVPTWAVSFGPRRIVFGADCAPNDAIVDLARGAEILLLEATLREPETEEPPGHLTPRQAGELAARAGVRRLVVTHVPDRFKADWVRAEARAGFPGGEVVVAREGDAYEA